MTAYVGLGANVGQPRSTLAHAVRALAALPGVDVGGVSRLYRTRPVGVVDQPDFHNAVVALEAPAGSDPATGALALLDALKALEAALGRRQRGRWREREVDLDLLLFGDHEVDVARPAGRWLRVPHPEMARRLFVLAPLAELAPSLTPPGWSSTIADAARQRLGVEGDDAVVPESAWSPDAGAWSG